MVHYICGDHLPTMDRKQYPMMLVCGLVALVVIICLCRKKYPSKSPRQRPPVTRTMAQSTPPPLTMSLGECPYSYGGNAMHRHASSMAGSSGSCNGAMYTQDRVGAEAAAQSMPVDYRLQTPRGCHEPAEPESGWSAWPQHYTGKGKCTTYNYGDENDDQLFRVLVTGKEHYPCNQCVQPYNKYGGAKAGAYPTGRQSKLPGSGSGATQCEIADTENRLLRTDKVYTRCRGVSSFDVLM